MIGDETLIAAGFLAGVLRTHQGVKGVRIVIDGNTPRLHVAFESIPGDFTLTVEAAS